MSTSKFVGRATSSEPPKPPPSVDWWVTTHCNLKCDFCFGPKAGEQDRASHLAEVLEQLRRSSARVVTFCGGEPLVVRNIDTLAGELRADGKRTVLNTNGLLLRRRVAQGFRWEFDAVGLSIHGSNPAVHAAMQGRGANLEEVIQAARYVKQLPSTSLKLATVVSKVNRDDLPALAKLVRDLRPDVWRLYQYSSRGPQNRGQLDHWLPEREFEVIAATARALADPVPTAPATEDVGAGCLIVDPDGNVLQPVSNGYVPHGNCLTEPLDHIWARMPHAAVDDNKKWLQVLPF